MMRNNVRFVTMIAAIASIFVFSSAYATLSVNIDSGRVSALTNVDASTFEVFGGIAGKACPSVSNEATCDNCIDNKATDDTRLVACNNTRIYPELIFQVTLKSDAVDGRPTMQAKTAGGTAGNNVPLDNNQSFGVVSKGTSVTLRMRWADICNQLTEITDASGAGGAAIGATCLPVGDGAKADFLVGFSPGAGTPDLTVTGAEKATVTVNLRKSVGEADETNFVSVRNFVDAEPAYVSYFRMNSGDKKAEVKDLATGADFPNETNIQFSKVRVLNSKSGFKDITPASPHADLVISGNSVSPKTVPLDNDGNLYYFKLALIDQANNVGFYTSDEDQLPPTYPPCTNGLQKSCDWTAVPGEVVGILAKNPTCFVATAAYGSWLEPEVLILRRFRNRFLLPNKWGHAFVQYYYAHSPKYAAYIAQNPTLRALTRVALTPFILYAWLSLQVGPAIAALLLAVSFASSVVGLRIGLRHLLSRSRGARA